MGLLQTLCLVKMDAVDGKNPPVKPDQVTATAGINPSPSNERSVGTELRGERASVGGLLLSAVCPSVTRGVFVELTPLLPPPPPPGNSDKTSECTGVCQRAL